MFDHWQEKASVRTRGLVPLELNRLEGFSWYPRAFIPYSEHPLLSQSEHQDSICLHFLLRHLYFTEFLEHEIVNSALSKIAKGQGRFQFPQEFRQAAFRLYIDEGYHAAYSAQLFDELCPSGKRDSFFPSQFFGGFQAILDTHSDYHDLILLCFATISETLITDMLGKAHHAQVHPTVRDFLYTHWRDEATHSTYFCQLWPHFFKQWTEVDREVLIELFPHLLRLYFTPETLQLIEEFQGYGLDKTTATALCNSIFDSTWLNTTILNNAGKPLLLARQAGLIGEPSHYFWGNQLCAAL